MERGRARMLMVVDGYSNEERNGESTCNDIIAHEWP